MLQDIITTFSLQERNPVLNMNPKKYGQSWQRSGRKGSLTSPLKFKNQDFILLRDHCLRHGLLFEDDTFPAHVNSIGTFQPDVLSEEKLHQIQWMRPTDIHDNPNLIVDDMSRFDILQGVIGDCWVLAALGSLTLQRRFLENVIPKDQGFKNNYAGIFHFRFWYFGEWVDVVIDDRLPFLSGSYLSVHPRSKNEFWPSLLEKAYAKLRGSYRKLHGGYISEALVDFTGGVQASFDLHKPHSNLHEIMKAAAKSECLMGCTTPGDLTGSRVLKNGIITGHAYTVTWAAEVPYLDRKECLIRIWNPWGRSKGEWKGPWSDGSEEWDRVPEQCKRDFYKNKDDGEFWISYQDFKQQFSFLYVCNNVPTFLDFGEQSRTTWLMDMHVNQWARGLTGSTRQKDALSRNPQYSFQVQEPDLKNYNVAVSLMQKPAHYTGSTELLSIGFLIRKVEPQDRTKDIIVKPEQMRDVTCCSYLSPGTYIIIPIASQGGQEFEFLLRIFLRSQNTRNIIRESNTRLSPMVPNDMPKWNQDNSYENIFLRYANQSSYLDASQLQRILNEVVLADIMASRGSGDGFSFDSCRSLLALMDISANGRLALQEFENFWRLLNQYKDIFRREAENNSGFLDVSSLRRIIQMAGLFISDKLLQLMATRYGDSARRLNFPDFLCCMIRLDIMAKVFRKLSADSGGIHFTENEWMTMIMYC
ncbi:calpain-13 [Hemicordylus capensis]|uniref:calpain-13 n=1 Tax=Hemicordylus capensis TaxID=884348 RepID=UPI0023029CB4|nr:calpain-13 [Hemicordylus capensis]